ncbi:MAG: amidotransferase [Actinobacteria bacterium HGW-Actinobacteria-10]|jgi:GMP synthase (glutamine-hydrolysing)|nr:MAG: amidotransferase [Actinobacteria bacterium HGW-Actinobacteria-10]
MHVQYLQHVEFEGPGALVEWAARRGHQLTATHVYSEAFEHPGECDLLVVLGGPMSVDQELEYPWLAQEKAYMRKVIAEGLPVLGICLGAQLVASVLGAQVTANPHVEIGWYPVELTDATADSAVFSALPVRFETLHWHGDTFAIPSGATHVARSAACENQAFEYDDGRVVGLQFHLEATPESWSLLAANAAAQLASGGAWVSSADEMLGRKALFQPANELFFELLDRMAARRARV